VILVVNKVDTEGHEPRFYDFARLGFEHSCSVSAAHGRGIGQLVDVIDFLVPPEEEDEEASSEIIPKLALVGRPNVGKSSLVNSIVKDKRSTVSEIAGTTRDTVDVLAEREGQTYLLLDTAGIRHRSRHNTSVEVFSVMRSEQTIRRADINILVIDATSGVTTQDKKIAGLIQEAKKPAIIALNKWDLVAKGREKDPELLREHTERIRAELFFLSYAPVVILSALTGTNVKRLFTMVEKVRQHSTRRAGTGELNRVLKAAMERQAPPTRGNRRFKVLYAAQAKESSRSPVQAPLFVMFVNDPKLIPDSYVNYLCARIRDKWEFPGLPILMRLRGREGAPTEVA
jgi:GTP-binding protein